ncbi:MAG: Holliday junction branch migration protein RuvA [Deferrisomatales bacterium]
MIASLSGRVDRTTPGEVVVDVGGVGYRVHVPLSTYAGLPGAGRECRLRVVTVVREDEISLYGFATAEEEELFRLLQGVSGVGPRLALKVLSGLSAPLLRQALAGADHGALTRVPGVGKKLAQRLVVELRDKVSPGATGDGPGAAAGPESEALAALEALGYPRRTAEAALETARQGGAATLETLIRDALRSLAPRR